MKTRIITARVDNYVNAEIEFLKSSLRLPNTTSVLTYAIHNLYETIKEEESQKSSLEMFEEKGLLGCFEKIQTSPQIIKISFPKSLIKNNLDYLLEENLVLVKQEKNEPRNHN